MTNDNMTYGEAKTAEKFALHMVNGEWRTKIIKKFTPQMKRSDASDYYSEKFRKYFGIEEIKKTTIPAYKSEGFDSIDYYYDYYEAKKYLNSISAV